MFCVGATDQQNRFTNFLRPFGCILEEWREAAAEGTEECPRARRGGQKSFSNAPHGPVEYDPEQTL